MTLKAEVQVRYGLYLEWEEKYICGLVYCIESGNLKVHVDGEKWYDVWGSRVTEKPYVIKNSNTFPKWKLLKKDFGYVIDSKSSNSSYVYMLYELTNDVAKFCDYWDAPCNPKCKIEIKKEDWDLWKGKINRVYCCEW